MAIQSRLIGSLTEIYVGGGNYLTQSYPTNFHQFWTKKILATTESIDDFKEVTSAERATIEAADAQWEQPSEEFIARAGAALINYNAETGYFECNGLTDISTNECLEMLTALRHNPKQPVYTNSHIQSLYRGLYSPIRTIPIIRIGEYSTPSSVFANTPLLEVVNIKGQGEGDFIPSGCTSMFLSASKLREIIGVIDMSRTSQAHSDKMFLYATSIKDVNIKNLIGSLSFSDTRHLSLGSLQYLTENAANTSTITVTLHFDVYAKLHSALSEEEASTLFAADETKLARWAELKATLSETEQADWYKVVTDGTDRNITFASAT